MSALTQFLQTLARSLADPVELFGHFTYFLLIVSMLMRRIIWLRALAVASGLTKIIYRAFLVLDPVSVVWEVVFVTVNLVQLSIIWYAEYRHRFTEEGNHFAANMPSGTERSAIKKLLEYSDLVRYEPGAVLHVRASR
jgi:hypothetical protein